MFILSPETHIFIKTPQNLIKPRIIFVPERKSFTQSLNKIQWLSFWDPLLKITAFLWGTGSTSGAENGELRNGALCYLHQHEFPQKLIFQVFAHGVKILQAKVAKNGGNTSV